MKHYATHLLVETTSCRFNHVKQGVMMPRTCRWNSLGKSIFDSQEVTLLLQVKETYHMNLEKGC